MHGKIWLILLTAGALVLAGCEPAEEIDPPPTPTTQPQGAPEPEPDPEQRPDEAPDQTASDFLRALEDGDAEAAVDLIAEEPEHLGVADPPPRLDREELEQEVAQTAQAIPEANAFDVLDSHVMGEYAIVATRFVYTEGDSEAPHIRPIVLVMQDAGWHIIWELFGMEPDEAFQAFTLTDRLQPLYDWYDTRVPELELDIVAGAQGIQPSEG